MAILMLLLGMVSAIVIVVFALQNGRVVTVAFLTGVLKLHWFWLL